MYRENVVKRKLKNKQKVLGAFSNTGSPAIVEMLGIAGLDFIIIDQEHGQGDITTLMAQLQAISGTPMTSLVRVPWNDKVYIKRVLDAGVEGIVVPSVETAEEARAAVAACRYPPFGVRGSGAGAARVSDYGMVKDYTKVFADNLLIALQIETVQAVENIDEILAVDGFDVAFIGPYDLSASAGQMGNLKHPDVAALLARAEERILASGKALGTVPHAGTTALDMFHKGYHMVASKNEMARIRDSVGPEIQSFREAFSA